MRSRCPICNRPLKGPLCVIHGPVAAQGTSIPTRTVAGVSRAKTLMDGEALKTPQNTIRDIEIGTLYTISSNTKANPTVVTVGSTGLTAGTTRYVYIYGSNSNPVIDGSYIATITADTTFTIPVNVSVAAGSAGTVAFFPIEWQPVAGSRHEVYTSTGVYSVYAKYVG